MMGLLAAILAFGIGFAIIYAANNIESIDINLKQ